MQSQLQLIEVETVIMSDHDFAIQHALRRRSGKQRIHKFRKVPVQRLLVAALDEKLSPVAENERPKTIPLGFKDPTIASRQFLDPFGKHRKDGRIHGEVHELMLSPHSVKRTMETVTVYLNLKVGNRIQLDPLRYLFLSSHLPPHFPNRKERTGRGQQ
jgi:hypothetical protein